MKRQSVIDYLKKMDRFYNLINQERTGNAREFAIKLHISERAIYYHISELRELGAVIEFDQIHQTYFFKNKFVMKAQFEVLVED